MHYSDIFNFGKINICIPDKQLAMVSSLHYFSTVSESVSAFSNDVNMKLPEKMASLSIQKGVTNCHMQ